MRINTTYTTTRAGAAKPTSKAKGSGFAEALSEHSSTSSTVATSEILPPLAAQEVDDALTARKKAMDHGHDLLDELEALRRALLFGGLSQQRLLGLRDRVSQQRQQLSDPKLASILDEIDLRVRVELAKFGL